MTYNELLNQLMVLSDEQLQYSVIANISDKFILIDDFAQVHELLYTDDQFEENHPILICETSEALLPLLDNISQTVIYSHDSDDEYNDEND